MGRPPGHHRLTAPGKALLDRPEPRGACQFLALAKRSREPASCVGAGVDHPQVRRRLVMSLPILVGLFAALEASVAPPKAPKVGAGSES